MKKKGLRDSTIRNTSKALRFIAKHVNVDNTEEVKEAYLYSKKGEQVNFKYPEPPYRLKGTLSDRCVVFGGEDYWVIYWNMVDLIRFRRKGKDEN